MLISLSGSGGGGGGGGRHSKELPIKLAFPLGVSQVSYYMVCK